MQEDHIDKDNPVHFGDKPIYNIGAVERMTDIPVATLRVWERRYGFPTPDRTAGGHRLYSESVVRRLQWVKARIDEGMQTRQAIRALQELEQRDQFLESRSLLSEAPTQADERVASLESAQTRLLSMLLDNDYEKADQILGELLALYPLEDLLLGALRPTLEVVGETWREGRISVAQEHAITQYLNHRLVMWMQTGPQPRDVPPVILACAPGEWHESSLLMLGVVLRRKRWPVMYLGQATPLPDLASYAHQLHPKIIVTVAMTEPAAQALSAWPQWLPEAAAAGAPVFAFGGRVFSQKPEWRARVPGVYLGDTLQAGLNTLEHLLTQTAISGR